MPSITYWMRRSWTIRAGSIMIATSTLLTLFVMVLFFAGIGYDDQVKITHEDLAMESDVLGTAEIEVTIFSMIQFISENDDGMDLKIAIVNLDDGSDVFSKKVETPFMDQVTLDSSGTYRIIIEMVSADRNLGTSEIEVKYTGKVVMFTCCTVSSLALFDISIFILGSIFIIRGWKVERDMEIWREKN